MVLKVVVSLGTFPYYRMFRFNTLQPILLIAAYTLQPLQHEKLLYNLDHWRTRKLAELQFISIAVSHLYPLARSTLSDPELSFPIDRFLRSVPF